MPQWTMRGLHGERWINVADPIQAQLRADGSGITGTLTNASGQRLDDCVLSGPWGQQWLGTLAPGATISIALPLTPGSGPGPLSQVYAVAFKQGSLPPAQVRLLQLKQQVLNTMWPTYSPASANASELGPVLFLGWGSPAAAAPEVDGRVVQQSGLGLLAVGLAVQTRQSAVVPTGLQPAHLWSAEGSVQTQFGGVALGNGALTVAAHLPTATALATVTLGLTVPGMQPAPGVTVSAYNRATGDFDIVPRVVLQTPRPVVAPTPVPVAVRGVASGARAAATAAPPLPSIQVVSSVAVAQAVAVVGKFPVTELDATLGPGDLSAYVDESGLVLFRISRLGSGSTTLSSMSVGYTLSGQP
jgi:hypothetical protein